MENASKALVIAGAILISILIIAIGMYIYSSSTNSIQSGVGEMDTQEIEAFNAKFTVYEGDQSGAQVKALISKLIANANTNRELPGRSVGFEIDQKRADGSDPGGALQTAEAGLPDTDIEDLIETLSNCAIGLELRHVYRVSVTYSPTTGLVNRVVVAYHPEDH